MRKAQQLFRRGLITFCVAVPGMAILMAASLPPRVIDVVADKDNRFKIAKQKDPVITMKANEVAVLRITAHKAMEWDDKDGSVHTFTINALKGKGWDFRLKDGVNQFPVVAPAEPGEYVVECTIKCGKGHDDMKMKLVVTP
jgi:heme/copper-type cytochrome/quinol oxidase subunit 2